MKLPHRKSFAGVNVPRSFVALVAALIALCAAPSTGHAQRASQNVRFSITSATQASISSGGSGSSFGAAPMGSYSAPSGQATLTTSSKSSKAPPLAQGPVVQQAARDSTAMTSAAGSVPAAVSVPIWQAQFTVANSEANKKVTVSLDAPMPDGADLTLELGASGTSVTAGMVVLGTAGTDAMTSMPTGSAAVIPLGFGVAAPAGSNAGARVVSFTLITGA